MGLGVCVACAVGGRAHWGLRLGRAVTRAGSTWPRVCTHRGVVPGQHGWTRACLCLGEGKQGLRSDVMGPSLLPRCLVAPSPHPGPGSECRLFQLAWSPTCVQPGGTGGPACGARVPKQLQGAHPAGRQPLSPTRGWGACEDSSWPLWLWVQLRQPWSACVVRRTLKWTWPLRSRVHQQSAYTRPRPVVCTRTQLLLPWGTPGQPRAHPGRAGSAVGVRAWAPVWAPGGLSPACQRSIDGAGLQLVTLG